MSDRKARIAPVWKSYFADADRSLLKKEGLPYLLYSRKQMRENINKYRDFFGTKDIDADIYFAYKASWEKELLAICCSEWIGVDVASEWELHDALDVWFSVDKIVVNGPKSYDFLVSCVELWVTIVITSWAEWKKICAIVVAHEQHRWKIKCMLRVKPNETSRFGLTDEEMRRIISGNDVHVVDIQGFTFHDSQINVYDKKNTIKQMIRLVVYCAQHDIQIKKIGIWWWRRVQYCTSVLVQQESREYVQRGMYGKDFIAELLLTVIDGMTFQQFLQQTWISLACEPGRALLDQVGCSCHQIIEHNEESLIVDSNIYELGVVVQEMPHDPRIEQKEDQTQKWYYCYGNTCLEEDLIYMRKVMLPSIIENGEYMIFGNVAGYFGTFSDAKPLKLHRRKKHFID